VHSLWVEDLIDCNLSFNCAAYQVENSVWLLLVVFAHETLRSIWIFVDRVAKVEITYL
jgi:hypothetical protein